MFLLKYAGTYNLDFGMRTDPLKYSNVLCTYLSQHILAKS